MLRRRSKLFPRQWPQSLHRNHLHSSPPDFPPYPLSHGACKRTCNPRAIATASHPEPRQSAKNPRTGFVPSFIAVPPAPTFTLALRCRYPRRLRRQHKAAHGFSGYAGAVLNLLHSEARRRLPAVKRTATMSGCVGQIKASQFALLNCTQPGRGKSPAIEHNRALPKVGQSLRRASLDGLPLCALRVRVMVGYVLRPSPDKSYIGCDRLVRLRNGGGGCFRAGKRGRWPALPVVS